MPPVRTPQNTNRGQQLAAAAAQLVGSYSWSGPSGPDEANRYALKVDGSKAAYTFTGSTPTTNHFAQSINMAGPYPFVGMQQVPQLAGNAQMNCWQVVFVCAIQAGLTDWPTVIRLHQRATALAMGTPGSVNAKKGLYTRTVLEALGSGDRYPLPGNVNPQAGDILFFDEAEHVAIAVGGNRDMYTLFNRDAAGGQDLDAPFIVGDITATAGSMALMHGVSYCACPF